MWDRPSRTDNVFGSVGGRRLPEVIAEYDSVHGPPTLSEREGDKGMHKSTTEASGADADEGGRDEGEEAEDLAMPTVDSLDYELDEALAHVQFTEADTVSAAPHSSSSEEGALIDPNAILATRVSIISEQSLSAIPNNRPNVFINWWVTDPGVVAAVEDMQTQAVQFDANLREACLPTRALHITFVTLRIDTQEEMAVAIKTLRSCRSEIYHLCPPNLPIFFHGVESFRDRVLYIALDRASCERFRAIAALIQERMSQAGITLLGNRSLFVPHLTVIKLSRALTERIFHISQGAYSGQVQRKFGSQAFDGLHLSRMAPLTASLPYYPTACVLANVPRCMAVEAAVHIAARAPPRTVFIMRGLPGTGKSTFVRALREALPQQMLTVCSADFFFEKEGRYTFDLSQLYAAHLSCKAKFEEALAKLTSFIVVDNTNVTRRDYQKYISLASQTGYSVRLLEMVCPTYLHLLACHSRCIHNVRKKPRPIWRCMYVCMVVCMYVCMYGCMYVCMYVWLYVCMYVCMVVCMYVCICMYTSSYL